MRSMVTVAAVLACLVLGALAVFQLLLVVGAPLGRFAWGGKHRVLPAPLRAGRAVSIAIYALLATVVLARAGLVPPASPQGSSARRRGRSWPTSSSAPGSTWPSRSKP